MDTGLGCCFCDKNIVSVNIDPCEINITSNWGKSPNQQDNQTLWAHVDCFRNNMHPRMQQHFLLYALSLAENNAIYWKNK